jgi:hypothetical protein
MRIKQLSRALAPMLATLQFGCVLGHVREAHVGPLASYPPSLPVRTEVTPGPEPTAARTLIEGADRAFAKAGHGPAPGAIAYNLRVALWSEANPTAMTPDGTLSLVREQMGLAPKESAPPRQWFAQGSLLSPDGKAIGHIRWQANGDGEGLPPEAGEDIGGRLAEEMRRHRFDYVERRAGDERLFFTPAPLTLAPGDFAISDDEVLLLRFALGLSRRVQLDLWLGGIVGGMAAALPPGLGFAGVGGLFALDLGLKVRLLDETTYRPGLSVSYDFLNLFGAAIGTVAGGGGVIGGIANANVQFNLFALSMGKHFGPVQITAGTYVLDNHHLIPQSTTGAVVGAESAIGGTTIDRVPTYYQPFIASELVFGPRTSLIVEALPQLSWRDSLFSTGLRILLGAHHPHGMLALDRVRFRLDLAVLWHQTSKSDDPGISASWRELPFLPWLGLAIYVL